MSCSHRPLLFPPLFSHKLAIDVVQRYGQILASMISQSNTHLNNCHRSGNGTGGISRSDMYLRQEHCQAHLVLWAPFPRRQAHACRDEGYPDSLLEETVLRLYLNIRECTCSTGHPVGMVLSHPMGTSSGHHVLHIRFFVIPGPQEICTSQNNYEASMSRALVSFHVFNGVLGSIFGEISIILFQDAFHIVREEYRPFNDPALPRCALGVPLRPTCYRLVRAFSLKWGLSWARASLSKGGKNASKKDIREVRTYDV
ncbi:hypothetical protein B0H10DRAFT_1970628 [Mycena sp. CBHHK59/15]|nr:hypothetical protein B0H10DRAFT_1970628 [Mycena sp. CBHHK59/15]